MPQLNAIVVKIQSKYFIYVHENTLLTLFYVDYGLLCKLLFAVDKARLYISQPRTN